MIPAARRAPGALRALSSSFAASSSRYATRSSIRSPYTPVQRCAIPSCRSFSSILPRLQQAAAVQEISQDGDDRPQEFTKFTDLADAGIISPKVVDTISKMNIHTMTDVQRMTLNHCLDGSDVIAQAKTGTGKTIAFLMPIVQRILKDPALEQRSRRSYDAARADDIRALIISPTRELAEQIAVEARKLVANTSVKVQTAVGGTGKAYHLQRMQRDGCHILVGTPGRVLDIVSDPGTGVSLQNIETFVLDEADRLLDIGFAPAINDIQSHMPVKNAATGVPRQNLMFSATVPKSVVNLVRQTLRPDFKFIRTIDPAEPLTHERIPQHVVFARGLQNQIPILMEIAHNAIQAHKKDPNNHMPFKAIVYFGSTAEVSMTFEAFSKMRDPNQPRSIFAPHPLEPCRIFQMHSRLEQARRTRESQGFRNAESAILFSTDVTARGMDFPDVSHVIQIGLPKSSDDYTHRIGRTGRAGKSGEGWLILNADERRDIAHKMRDSGVDLKEASLVTSDLDMTRGAQIPSHIARLLKLVEVGVKSVPYSTKAATYSALIGVLQQQNPHRHKQDQLDMMNELAKFGWGMTEPPALSRTLVSKLGLANLRGIRVDEPQGGFGRDRDRDGRGHMGMGRRGGFDDLGGRSSSRLPHDGQGVFGGSAGGDAFDAMGYGRDSSGSSGSGRSHGRGGARGRGRR